MPTISRPDMNEYILILSVLYNANKNEIHGQTRFQKLVYKIQRKINTEDCIYTYKFNEYDTGMFSRDLQRTLKKCEYDGLISISIVSTYDGTEKYIYSLTNAGRQRYNRINPTNIPEINTVSENVVDKYRNVPVDSI